MQGFIYKNKTNKKQFLAMKKKIFNLSNLIMLIKALTSFQKRHFKAAMLIDADNVTPNLVKYALEKTEQDYGKIKKRLIYGNWASPNLNSIWNESIRKFRLERVDNHSKSKGKNSTDICMTIGAMDLLHKENIDIFILVSSDSDFINLVHRLKDAGKVVIGYGLEANTNTQNSYDEFYIASRDKFQPPAPPKKENIHTVSLKQESIQESLSEPSQQAKEELKHKPLAQKEEKSKEESNATTNKTNEGKFEGALKEKFSKDVQTAYNLSTQKASKVSINELYEQYKKIDRAIQFFHFNKFIEEVKNTEHFEFIFDINGKVAELKLKSPSVS